jgi:hypothetical protein
MTLDHDAIRRVHPNAVTIDDGFGSFDVDGNSIEIDVEKVLEISPIVKKEKELENARYDRSLAYVREADPLFFKAQRGEATLEEWEAKIEEIRQRFPYPK